MQFYKKLYYKLFSIFLLFILTGCVHQIDKQGITLSVTESELSESFDDSFPLKKEFIFGSISVNKPKINIIKNSNRIKAHINLKFLAMYIKPQYGNFSISGEPYFNKKKNSIFLKNIKIDKFKFAELRLGKEFNKTFLSSLNPMINRLFNDYPIYKIPDDSIQGSFVQDIKIADSKLLITYGI